MQPLRLVQIVAIVSVYTIRGEEMYRRALRVYQAYLVEIKSYRGMQLLQLVKIVATFSVCTIHGEIIK